jgi:DNA invertase Pin-like site-specific DNA recombinase
MLTVLGGLAEFERELIRSRTDEGRKRAQARGVRFGRKPALTPYQRQEALQRRAQGEPLRERCADPGRVKTLRGSTRNFEACGYAQSKKMQKFLLRSTLQPN